MRAPKRDRSKARPHWLERADTLPEAPGVYLMKDAEGAVIYVGKAKNLRARVRSYFQEGTSDYRAFVGLLETVLADLETVVTRSEKEALLLEREMIRRYEPIFNVVWKDDKQYLCLRVDTSHEYPWVQVVRNMQKDGARYFGPFHSASAARQTLRVVNRHFRLRTCRDSVLENRARPCLEYQIGRCPAPCVFDVDRDAYRESVGDVLMFLEGKKEELADRLRHRMWGAAERLEYEVAAHYRDQLRAVEKTLERQKVVFPSLLDQDAFGLYREGEEVCISVVEVRDGRVQNIVVQSFERTLLGDADLVESAILQRYALAEGEGERQAERAASGTRAEAQGGGVDAPAEVLVPAELPSAFELRALLRGRTGRPAAVRAARRGDRRALLDLARENAAHGFRERQLKSGAVDRTLEELRRKLRLSRPPFTIECYDISNMGAELIVASRVVFERGLPDKKRYRHYRVRSTKGQDDFGSLYEVLERRLRRGLAENDLPDLVVIDGGKGQLNAARAAAQDLGIEGVDIIALAKSRTLEGEGAGEVPHSPERVFVPLLKDPIVLGQSSAELLLLARIRDEAHRFAITFQGRLFRRRRIRSELDAIRGVGPARRKALLEHVGSVKRVREATVEELEKVPGIGRKAAEAIYRALHPGAADIGPGPTPS